MEVGLREEECGSEERDIAETDKFLTKVEN